MQTTAQRLKAYMIEDCRNQAAVARKAGIRKSTMCEKLAGKRKFTIDEIQRICAVLNVRPSMFIDAC